MTKLKKIILIIVALILLIIIFYLIKSEFNNSSDNGKNENKVTEIAKSSAKINKPTIVDTIDNSLNKINWLNYKYIYPKNINIYKIDKKNIDESFIKKMVSLFGSNVQPIVNEKNFVLFENDKKNSTLGINKRDSLLRFGLNIDKNDSLNKKYNEGELISLFLNFIKNNFNLPSEIEIDINKIEYETVSEDSFIKTDKDKASSIYIKANYKIDGNKIYSPFGNSITASYSFDGTLLHLEIYLPFEKITKYNNLAIKTIDELKRLNLKDFQLFLIDDPMESVLFNEGKNVEITSMEVDDINLIYKYDPNDSYLQPFLSLSGKGKFEENNLSVIFLTPALSETEYQQ